jgi:hypothetical protein
VKDTPIPATERGILCKWIRRVFDENFDGSNGIVLLAECIDLVKVAENLTGIHAIHLVAILLLESQPRVHIP